MGGLPRWCVSRFGGMIALTLPSKWIPLAILHHLSIDVHMKGSQYDPKMQQRKPRCNEKINIKRSGKIGISDFLRKSKSEMHRAGQLFCTDLGKNVSDFLLKPKSEM